jgi:hypothetical protein
MGDDDEWGMVTPIRKSGTLGLSFHLTSPGGSLAASRPLDGESQQEQQQFESKWGPGGASIRTIVLELEAALRDCKERLVEARAQVAERQEENARLHELVQRLRSDTPAEVDAYQRTAAAEAQLAVAREQAEARLAAQEGRSSELQVCCAGDMLLS